MVLVPQVVDVAGDIPVVAAGGIADGRGLAAALALGAQGVSMGTRFLAIGELAIADEWKRRIVEADALDAVKVANSERVMPPYTRPAQHGRAEGAHHAADRAAARAPGVARPGETGRADPRRLLAGRGDEYLPFAGESAGLIDEVLPAAEIVRRVVAEAQAALERVP